MFESLAEIISELDVLLRFADLASSCPTPYTRPDITSSVLNLLFSQLLHSSRICLPSLFIPCFGWRDIFRNSIEHCHFDFNRTKEILL